MVKWGSVASGAVAVATGSFGIYSGAAMSATGAGAVVGVPTVLASSAALSWGVSEMIAGFLDNSTDIATPSPVTLATLASGGDMNDAKRNELIYNAVSAGAKMSKLTVGSPSNSDLLDSAVDAAGLCNQGIPEE